MNMKLINVKDLLDLTCLLFEQQDWVQKAAWTIFGIPEAARHALPESPVPSQMASSPTTR